MRHYRPSNGTEGTCFEEKFCMNCINCDPNPNGKKQCDIWMHAIMFDLNDEEYPKEWVYDHEDNPTCTAHVKWDWGNDGNPDDPDNPKVVPPDDPNQLCLPFEFNSILKEKVLS